jgi:hypothetical protein
MKCSKRSFTVVSVLFALLLSLSTGTLNARDADLASLTFAAAQTAKPQCINTCRARYRDCLSLKQIPSSECRGIYRIAPATLVMLVQLVDRLGQGFRGDRVGLLPLLGQSGKHMLVLSSQFAPSRTSSRYI